MRVLLLIKYIQRIVAKTFVRWMFFRCMLLHAFSLMQKVFLGGFIKWRRNMNSYWNSFEFKSFKENQMKLNQVLRILFVIFWIAKFALSVEWE